jgi:hypothetical protein
MKGGNVHPHQRIAVPLQGVSPGEGRFFEAVITRCPPYDVNGRSVRSQNMGITDGLALIIDRVDS